MRLISRAAVRAASLLCILGLVSASPATAAGLPETPVFSATALLASVTAPMIAADLHALQAHAAADFSSGAAADPAKTRSAAVNDDGTPSSLAELVDRNATADASSDDDRCLATGVYYESQGEPLRGQLAVAQTILNRASSGRFADSACGVVRQPGQFSFLHRGGRLPDPPRASDAWAKAVAIAKIARAGLWHQIAPAALYFHARHVNAGWGRTQVAAIGNHVFFR